MGRSTGATPAGWREHHVALLTYTRSTGTRRGPPDLLIAATARVIGRTLVTTDQRAPFDELPDVAARLVTG